MQSRPDVGTGPGLSFRRPGPAPPFPAPPLRGGFLVDYGPRVDDRRYPVQVLSRQQQQQQQQVPSPKSFQGDDQEEAPPSRHLWVGNVSQEVTEVVLVEKFSKFGSIESVTVYSQRNYAFINFRNLENARDAKNGLQGVVLGGLAMRIEFAKGAKPSRHLWVGGIGQTVSREEIESEFKRFGMMEDFKFLRDRNCAFVDYEKVEDATAAVDSLNRKRLGDEELRVDFGRSQPPKREAGGRPGTATSHEEWGGLHLKGCQDQPDQFRGPTELYRGLSDVRKLERGLSVDSFHGSSGGYQAGLGPGTAVAASGRSRGEKEEPSDVLWVGFPLLSKVDEESLRRAFVPFGVVERVKTFPGRTYAFVQFKNVVEASRAKVALEGKLFDDPRVHIRFSNSEIGPVDNPRTDGNLFSSSPGKDAPGFSQKVMGRIGTSDRFGSIVSPLRSTGLRPEYFPGGLARGAALARAVGTGAVISLGRGVALGPGGPDTRIPTDERDYQIGSQDGRGLPGPNARLGRRHPGDEQWDLIDEEITARDPKRLRMLHAGDTESSGHSHFQGGRRHSELDNFGPGPDSDREGYGLRSSHVTVNGNDYIKASGVPSVHLGPLQFEQPRHAAAGQRETLSAAVPGAGPASGFAGGGKRDGLGTEGVVAALNEGWRWHGTIAKGGTPVCRARCLPVGKGIDVTVPDVVNCTARTDLDMLAKHVYQAGDFGVVFFVPEADPDVPPYHDFMHYLGEKHRAGVAKLVDGTTLFLVPPSEFSERVLKVPGNNCLFGVVLRAQQPSPVGHAQLQQQQPLAPARQQHHLQQQLFHPLQQHAVLRQQQHTQSPGPVFVNGHSPRDIGAFRVPLMQKGQGPALPATSSTLTQSQLTSLADGLPTVLTPDLIASLTALLPLQNESPVRPTPPQMSGSSMFPPLAREGACGSMGRIAPNSGSSIPAPATMDNRLTYRPPQSHQQCGVQSQGWSSAESDHQSGTDGHISVPLEQGSGHAPPPQQAQAPQAPSVSVTQPFPGPLLGLNQQGYPGAQSQGSGYLGQPLAHQPRHPQHPSIQSGSVPLLPSDQLAQLTALLTQRQQLPAQQQQAAQLLQQHYQQQHPPLHPLPQQHHQLVHLPSHQSQAHIYDQQLQQQQQHYALQTSSQPEWSLGGPLPSHLSQSIGHPQVLSGCWDGLTATQGRQLQKPHPHPHTQPQQPVLALPQLHLQQSLPTVGVTGEAAGGASQDDAERQKRFQATLQLAAALLQQMQHQQSPGQGNPEQL